MDFYIAKGANLPKLKMKLISDGVTDYQKFNELLNNACATFSMVNIENGIYKLANVEADIVVNTIQNTNDVRYEYFIEYQWKGDKDTNKTGSYIAEFKIDFFGDNTCESLIVPISEKLYIHVQDSITKTTRIKL